MGQLVQFQQRAARLAADGCDAGMATDMAEKENVKEKVLQTMLPQPKCVVMATHRRRNWFRARA